MMEDGFDFEAYLKRIADGQEAESALGQPALQRALDGMRAATQKMVLMARNESEAYDAVKSTQILASFEDSLRAQVRNGQTAQARLSQERSADNVPSEVADFQAYLSRAHEEREAYARSIGHPETEPAEPAAGGEE